MNNLIERYVYDVIQRLPEKDRDEVSKELNSNIYDMLSNDTDENEIKTVLYKMGSPASLAEKYRLNPRYLISPATYDEYVRTLKIFLPLVGIALLIIGSIWGAIDSIKDGMVNLTYMISNTLSKAVSLGLSATLQTLIWITIGFVIAERTGTYKDNKKDWKIEELPEVLPSDKSRIPLSESIIELVLTAIFSAAVILACSGMLPISFIILNGDTEIHTIFSSGFLAVCIPAIAVMAIIGMIDCIIKIKIRRWTSFVCSSTIISSLTNMSIMIYLINRPDLFSVEFTAFIQSINWGDFDIIRFMGTGGTKSIIIFISIIIVILSLVNCCMAVYKTLKYRNIPSQEKR